MIQETGRIIEIKEIDGTKTAIVECVSKSACKSCSNNDNCGVGVVAKSSRSKLHHLSVPFEEGMNVDASVDLLIENKDIIQSSMIVYVVPLVFFIVGTLAGYSFLANELMIIITSVLFLVIGVYVAKAISNKVYPSHKINKLVSTK